MKRWLPVVGLFFCLTLSIQGVCFSKAQDFEDPGKQIAFIPGQISKAFLAAYEDFSKKQAESSKNPNETAQITSKLENYNIEVFDKDNVYIIYFSLNHRKFLWIRGGGAEYKINKSTYSIVDKTYWR